MATLEITSISADPVYLSELYTSVQPGKTITIDRATSDLAKMKSLQAALTAGTVTLTVTNSADEQGSGLLTPTNSVEARDFAAVAAADYFAPLQTIRVPLTSGGSSGTADTVTVYAVDTVPYKVRIVDAWVRLSVAAGGSALRVRTATADGGTLLATVSSAATGKAEMSDNASGLLTPASNVGLFVYRTDRSVTGELVLVCRRES